MGWGKVNPNPHILIVTVLLLISYSSSNAAGHETSTPAFKLITKGTIPAPRDVILHSSLDCTNTTASSHPQILIRNTTHMSLYNAYKDHVSLLSTQILGFMDESTKARYPIGFLTSAKNLGKLVTTRDESGLCFYKVENSPPYLQLLYEASQFADVHGWIEASTVLKWGWFYPTKNHFGLLTRDKKGKISFYTISWTVLMNRGQFPLRQLSPATPLKLENWWSDEDTDFQILQLGNGEPDKILARSSSQFAVYTFDKSYQLKRESFGSGELSKSRTGTGHMLFASLAAKSPLKYVLRFNTSGLYIGKLNERSQKFHLVMQDHTHFSAANGWNPDNYKSLQSADIDGDGIEELVYYEPGGLELMKLKENGNMTWNLTKLEGTGLSQTEKYLYPLAATRCGLDGALLVLEDGIGNIVVDEVKLVENVANSSTPQSFSPMVFSFIPSFPKVKRVEKVSQKWQNWFDIWGDNHKWISQDAIINTANPGQVDSTLPLFSYKGINLQLSYHSSRHRSGLFGVGWSLPIGKDYIFMETRSSVFEDAHLYYLSLDGALFQLHRKLVPDSSDTLTFCNPEQDLNATYFISDASWNVSVSDDTYIFGGKLSNSVQESLVWTWGYHGSEIDANYLQPQPVAWYLTQRFVKRGSETQRVDYNYGSKKAEVGKSGKFYTTEIRLEEMVDLGNSIVVQISYNQKSTGEYAEATSTNPDGTLSFPVPLMQSMYVSSVFATTPISKQLYNLTYSITTNGKRVLDSIYQFVNSQQTLLVHFEYDELNQHQSLLSSIKIPSTGLREKIEYRENAPTSKEEFRTFPINEMGGLENGPGYLLLHYLKRIPHDAVILEIYQEDTIASVETSAICRMDTGLISGGVSSYSVAPYNTFILAITKTTDKKQRIHVFPRNDSCSSSSTTGPSVVLFYNSSTLIHTTSFFLAAITPGHSEIHIMPTDEKANFSHHQVLKLDKILGKHIIVVAQPTFLAIYDDAILILVHKMGIRIGFSTFHGFPSFALQTKNFFNNFDIYSELKDGITNQIVQSTLKAQANSVLLSTFDIVGDTTHLRLEMLELSPTYSISKRWSRLLSIENLLDLSQSLNNNDGSTFIVKYEKERSKYQLKVTSVNGNVRKGVDSIRNQNKKEDALSQLLKDLNNHDQWKTLLRNMTLLNWAKYETSFSPQGLCVGVKTLINRKGEVKTVPAVNKISLGFHLSLVQQTGTQYQVVETEGGKLLTEITVSPAWNILLNFPFFIAYQQNSTVSILPFTLDGKGLGPAYALIGEKLHPLTSPRVGLVTTRSNKGGQHASSKVIVVRPPTTFQRLQVFRTSKVETSTVGGLKRSVGYEYDDALKKTFRIIPGGNKNLNGWTDAVFFQNGTSQQNFYNIEGSLVKSVDLSPTPTSPPNNSGAFLLKSKTGELTILDSTPILPSDDMVDFHSFNQYEQKGKWLYNSSDVKGDMMSFTGQSYLELQPSSTFQRLFTPKDQAGTYIASCWVRGSFPLSTREGDNTPFFKVIYLFPNSSEVISIQGKIRAIKGDWIYSEIVISLPYALEEIYSPVLGTPFEGNTSFSISFRIFLEPSFNIHVDHITLYPESFDLAATIYSLTQGLKPVKTEIVGNGGYIRRFHYDRKGTTISESSDDGSIQFLKSRRSQPKLSLISFETRSGFFESWDNASFRKRWQVDGSNTLSRSKNSLSHEGAEPGKITLKGDPSIDSFAVRFDCKWQERGSYITLNISGNSVRIGSEKVLLNAANVDNSFSAEKEVILLIVKGRMVMWLDTRVVIDQGLKNYKTYPLSIELKGRTTLASFFYLPNPSVQVTYYNKLNEPIQDLDLESESSVIGTQTLYDTLGRPFVKTKNIRITQSLREPLLKYHSNFVISMNSTTKEVKGMVASAHLADDGYPFYTEEYENFPGGPVLSRGLPGNAYKLGSQFGTRTQVGVTIPFIDNMFPAFEGFTYKSRSYGNGKYAFWVYKEQLVRAAYVKSPMFDHRLTTYDYNGYGNLVLILPPSYHKAVDSFSRLVPWNSSGSQAQKVLHGTFFAYDQTRRLTSKTSRAEGTIHFLYDQSGRLRFRVYQPWGSKNFTKSLFTYFDHSGILIASGIYTKKIHDLKDLTPYLGDEALPLKYTHTFQEFSNPDYDSNTSRRDKKKLIITNNEDAPLVEELQYDSSGEVVRKSILHLNSQLSDNFNVSTSSSWVNERTERFCYPSSEDEIPLCLLREYNALGLLVSIRGDHTNIRFTYNAQKQVVEEKSPGNTRKFVYDSPGFLTSIRDSFSSQSISYVGQGYSQSAQGGGIANSFEFVPTWKKDLNKRNLRLMETNPLLGIPLHVWTLCLAAFRRSGILTPHNIPTGQQKDIATELSLPIQCGGDVGNKLSNILAQFAAPESSGYKIDYGSHGQVLRAKYTTPGQGAAHQPLQPSTFSERLPILSVSESLKIWNQLVQADIIIVNQPTKNTTSHIGTLSEEPIFTEKTIEGELRALDVEASQFSDNLLKLLAHYLLDIKQTLSYSELENKILQWSGYVDSATSQYLINKRKALIKRIFDTMVRNKSLNYLFNKTFLTALGPYQSHSHTIVKLLLDHQYHALGKHPFDFDVLDVDVNGNQIEFIQGHSIYEVGYKNDSVNQIETVTQYFGHRTVSHNVKHDTDGNIIQAGHKKISSIAYHPITKRPTSIDMEDGTKLYFSYDGQGERVLKQCYSPTGYLVNEVSYFRDERGRVLTEKRVTREEASDSMVSKSVTHFIYGPRSLVGFLRDGTFFDLTTDNLGSVRIVTRGQEVVAAYDYFPYGGVRKVYVGDPRGQLDYRFAGKEWDEETQLYNFHARLYDPTLGRFFQTDPMSQYPSPYIYAGNSPFSLVDPDGEEVITLIVLGIIGAGVGGYFGGAAVNNRWNPADWDFKDPGTYFGIGGGALAGALLPVGFAGSVAAIGGIATSAGLGVTASTVIGVSSTITLGTGVAYLSSAAANNKWNPAEWEWDRPHTFNALFQGFAIGSSIPAGVSGVQKLVTKIAGESTKLKALLITSNFVGGGGVAYGMGVTVNDGEFNPLEWDWSSPQTISSLATGFYSGYAWSTLIAGSAKGIYKITSSSSSFKWNGAMIKAALKNPKSPIYKSLGGMAGAYAVGAMANEDFDITSWNFKSFTTYQGILNGVYMGKGISTLVAELRSNPSSPSPRVNYDNLPQFMKHNPSKFATSLAKAVKQMLYRELKAKFGLLKQSKSKTPTAMYKEAQLQSQQLERRLSQHSQPSERSVAQGKLNGINCIGVGRVRRALNPSCLIPTESRANAARIKLNANPPDFLETTPLSTLHFDSRTSHVVNNEIVRFNLQRFVTSASPNAYALVPIGVSFSLNVQNTISAYYLQTKDTITFPASPDGRMLQGRMAFNSLVVTPEMGGCSLYTKYNQDSNTITMFHHYRYSSVDTPGNMRIHENPETGIFKVFNPKTNVVEEYTDVLRYEKYHGASSSSSRPMAASTVVVYFDSVEGTWKFGNQMISYSTITDGPHRGGIGEIAVEGFATRTIKGIPRFNLNSIKTEPIPVPPGA